jgi:hypothetical protein
MPPQISRLVLLTIAIVVGYGVARWILTPESFGQYGHYRGKALRELTVRPPTYAGQDACDECHAPVRELYAKSQHKPIACETCHGPCLDHAENSTLKNSTVKTKPLTDSLCLGCHTRSSTRPAWLKQIEKKTHYDGACIECHLPHHPTEAPEAPKAPKAP